MRKVDLKTSITDHLGSGAKAPGEKTMRNVGPSVTYRLRDDSGQAREFHNYMLPVNMGDAGPVFLLGMRENPADPLRYLRLPADDKGSLDGFLRLQSALAEPALRAQDKFADLAHRPGALLASLAPFAKQGVNLLKIESRPIHGRPWEYQFFIDVEALDAVNLDHALAEVRKATSELRVLGRYVAASR
mgnify:CR=1 FL=1